MPLSIMQFNQEQRIDKEYGSINNQQAAGNQKSIFDSSDLNSFSSVASLNDVLAYSLKDDSTIDKLFGNKRKKITPVNFTSTDTQDGVITGTYQQGTGDCWLLAGVNALSYTEEGRRIIKEALDYQDNGDTVVHLKGAGDYTVTKAEIEAIKKQQKRGSGQY